MAWPVRAASPNLTPDFGKITKSVFKVSATSCVDQQIAEGTGFLWSSPNSVVTALHVVAGCDKIAVTKDEQTLTATLTRVLKKADLALLTVSGLAPLPALHESGATLADDQDLWAWGFQEGGPTPSERKFQKLTGARTLGEFVNTAVANDIKNSGMPDLGIEIIYVSGLVPGLSGAPILDASGAVVGIGEGGLNGGSVGINWATPQKYLHDLAQSTEDTASMTSRDIHQFSFGRQLPSASQVFNCGGYSFTHMPSFMMGSALMGTDDPKGLQQLTNSFGVVGLGPETIFDAYQELASGATLVLPQGSILSEGASGCSATFPGTPLKFTIERSRYMPSPDLAGAISLRTQFDSATLSPSPAYWQPNSLWTSPAVWPRWDGFAARRVNWLSTRIPGGPPDPNGDGIFTTVAIKNGVFLGVSVHVPSGYLLTPQFFSGCVGNPALPGCPEEIQHTRKWGAAVIAVHLTTFPLGVGIGQQSIVYKNPF